MFEVKDANARPSYARIVQPPSPPSGARDVPEDPARAWRRELAQRDQAARRRQLGTLDAPQEIIPDEELLTYGRKVARYFAAGDEGGAYFRPEDLPEQLLWPLPAASHRAQLNLPAEIAGASPPSRRLSWCCSRRIIGFALPPSKQMSAGAGPDAATDRPRRRD